MTTASRPKLVAKARLRIDRIEGRCFLLAPERGFLLNETAQQILALCEGEHSIQTILDHLASRYGEANRERMESQVIAFLNELKRQGLIREGPAGGV